jgi:hypothetical protein
MDGVTNQKLRRSPTPPTKRAKDRKAHGRSSQALPKFESYRCYRNSLNFLTKVSNAYEQFHGIGRLGSQITLICCRVSKAPRRNRGRAGKGFLVQLQQSNQSDVAGLGARCGRKIPLKQSCTAYTQACVCTYRPFRSSVAPIEQ